MNTPTAVGTYIFGFLVVLLIGLVIVVTVAWSASHATASHSPLQRENHA